MASEKLRDKLEAEYGGSDGLKAVLLPLVVPTGLMPTLEAMPTAAAESDAGPAADGTARSTRGSGRFSVVARSVVSTVAIITVVVLAAWVSLADYWTENASWKTRGPDRSTSLEEAIPVVGSVRPEPLPAPVATPMPTQRARTAPPESGPNVVVLDANTGEPIAAASVYAVRRTESRSSPLGTSDEDGLAALPATALQRDGLLVSAEGYVEFREPAVLRDADAAPYPIELEPAFEASIQVLYPDDSPASGIVLTVEPRLRGLDDSDAEHFVTDEIGIASYVFRYQNTAITVDVDGFATVSVAAATPVTKIRLSEGRRVEGIVRDESRQPISDCSVKIASTFWARPHWTSSDEDGRFPMGSFAKGEEVTVSFYHADYPSYRDGGPLPNADEWAFQLPDGVTLEGSVRTADGAAVTSGVAFIMVAQAIEEDDQDDKKGFITRLNTAGVPERGRGQRRLVPLLRSMLDDNGGFSLGPNGGLDTPAYLFVFHNRLENYLERLTDLNAVKEIVLAPGASLSGRLVTLSGDPIAGARLHIGEVWSDGVEGIVGRTKTREDGSFLFTGLPTPEESLPGGVDDGDPKADVADVYRALVFMAAFAPDELLELNNRPIDESEVWGGFAIEREIEASETIVVVGAKRSTASRFAVRLLDGRGAPVRSWTPTVLFGVDDAVETGVVGRNLRNPRFYSGNTLRAPQTGWDSALLCPEGFLWQEIDLATAAADIAVGDPVDVAMVAIKDPVRLVLENSVGQQLGRREIFVAVPFGDEEKVGVVGLGTTGEDGSLDVSFLSPGAYECYALPASPKGQPNQPFRVGSSDRGVFISLEEIAPTADRFGIELAARATDRTVIVGH